MPRPRSKLILAALLFSFVGSGTRAQSWKILVTGVDTNLRGISAAKIVSTDHIAIWAAGSHGIVLRSVDDGASWNRVDIPGRPDLDFRGIVAFDENTAYLMASGEGQKSRIYKTTNGGTLWELQYTDLNKSFFLDSIACVSPTKCFALGDPLSGPSGHAEGQSDARFLILQTSDGRRWNPLPPQNLPTALPKEGAFAASNSNLLAISESELFVVTGGFAARVIHTVDAGKTWTASAAPIAADNASSGIFAIARAGENHFVVVGGDYTNPLVALRIAAASTDGTKSWTAALQQPTGYRSAVVVVSPGASPEAQALLTVGPTGADTSPDSGLHWNSFASKPLNALFALDEFHIYAVGPNGAINQFVPPEPKQ
jgi:photosystem II stability/assembly factor-like uncharacterized protein